MYHKMPLINDFRSLKKKKLLKSIHKKQAALSSKKRMYGKSWEASYDTYPHVCDQPQAGASVTLEMAVVLPLFVSFMVFFLFLFRVLLVQESMEEALVYASRTIAAACWEESVQEQKPQAELFAAARLALQKGWKESGCPLDFIRGKEMGVSLLASRLTGDDIVLRASYEIRLPCVLLGTYSLHFVQCAQSRKWIGNCTLEQTDGSDDEWVYITPYGTVYHRDRACRYLDLNIRAASRQSLPALRNADGKIYRQCEHCGASGSGTVYVTDYGDRYHTSLSCSGLKRTIYMVKLSQTGGRKACSKCGARQQS